MLSRALSPLAALALLALAACGPIYDTDYSFIPPGDTGGRMCVNDCLQQKAYCENRAEMRRRDAEMRRERCLADARDEAEYAYRRYKRERRADNKPIKKTPHDFMRSSYCPSVPYADDSCEEYHRICYVNCGGRVLETKTCVLNCGQVPQGGLTGGMPGSVIRPPQP